MNTKERILSELNELEEILTDLSEGYLNDFEDVTEASAKYYIEGLLDYLRTTTSEIKDLYKK
jgi:hypothetical protein